MISNTNNAVYIEKITEQDANDTDWVKEAKTTVSYAPKEIVVDSSTTNTKLVSTNVLTKADAVKVVDSNNAITVGNLGTITTIGTVNTLNVLGDDSCIATYPFNGNANDLSGNYNGTWVGNEEYDTGKFGQAAKLDGNSYIKANLNSFNNIMSNFFWVNLSTSANAGITDIETSDQTSYHMSFYTDANSTLYFYYYDGGVAHIDLGYTLNTNVFYNIGFVRDDTNKYIYIYINGTLEKTITYSGTLASSTYFSIYGYAKGCGYYTSGLIDQVRIFNKTLTATEVNTLYTEQNTKYSADITALNLANTPTKAFFRDDVTTSICVEANAGRVINLPHTPVNIDATSTNTSLVSTTALTVGEEVIINDVTDNLGTVVFDSNTNLYTADITSYNLNNKPFKAMKRDSEVLTKTSSTTTEFVGTSDKNGLMVVGDSVRLDGTINIDITSVSESGTSSPYTYTIGFDAQPTAPTTCEIMSRDTVMTKDNEVFDGTKFNITYNDELKQGRAINRKIEVQNSGTTVFEPLQTQLWKKDS